jgi:hypothetical protein
MKTDSQARPIADTDERRTLRPKPRAAGRRIQVRRSGIHGKGVFA